jgi:hypothetical protein
MNGDEWGLAELQGHLQDAIDLEMFTIPFYMSALYSIIDPSDRAFQLVQSVAHQEMLHVVLAANVANAYGATVTIRPPDYTGDLPHLKMFDGFAHHHHHHGVVARFSPYSARIGPLDVERINAMCLIEYPKFGRPSAIELKPTTTEYDSIGHFYDAVRAGLEQRVDDIVGNRNQVKAFEPYYSAFAGPMEVTEDGTRGWGQVDTLIRAVVTQGEGQDSLSSEIPEPFRNTADDPAAVLDHFDKFVAIRDEGRLPEVYTAEATERPTAAQQRLMENFALFCDGLQRMFRGGQFQSRADDPSFEVVMTTLGSNIRRCWQTGVVPVFSTPMASGQE